MTNWQESGEVDITFPCSIEVEGGVCGRTDEHFHIWQDTGGNGPLQYHEFGTIKETP